jgi:hypothetical protein
MHFTTWMEVRDTVDAITSNPSDQFDGDTVANAFDVLSACESKTSMPMGVKKGYWPTISVWWEGFELEVFEDRVEVYVFRSEGGTDIWYEDHAPGAVFSPRFLTELESHAT